MYSILAPRSYLFATVVLSLGPLSACDSGGTSSVDNLAIADGTSSTPGTGPGSNSEIVSELEDRTAAVVGTINAEFTGTTQGFAEAASIHNMYEKAAADIALERSLSAEIRAFAREVLAENGAWGRDLADAVHASNIPIHLPAEIDARHSGMIANLTGASAEDFDSRYADQQINTNEELQILLENYIKDGRSPAVREFAAGGAPTVKQRLENAEMLSEALSAEDNS
jgi:putative membrane protein